MNNKFQVHVTPSSYEFAQMSITHDGYQWMAVGFDSREEIEKTIKALQNYIAPAPAASEGDGAKGSNHG